ncbi:hypothetical protein SAMN04488505_11039 [Chitinophaga rupis]|uniref:Uncharacterized protein n=1 Tax=Chitinophaga rupis TaxID=573321 RepID=A0A1H8G4Z0_9BACT|nr:hypothetical protein SAMN04488505_11039 [Chitinophaga rupis]
MYGLHKETRQARVRIACLLRFYLRLVPLRVYYEIAGDGNEYSDEIDKGH